MEVPFCPRPRDVEPWLYPMCLVQIPKPSEQQWWVAWYLPDLDSALQVQQVLHKHRATIDPSRQPQLDTKMSRWKADYACVLYERLGSMELDLDNASEPVWLLMGPNVTILPYRHLQPYLSEEDPEFISQMAALIQQAPHNPDLKQALEDFKDYHQWTKRQPCLTKVLGPPKPTTRNTSIALENGDSATVVTNASAPLDESPVTEIAEPNLGKRNNCRARSKSQSQRPSKRLKPAPKSSPQSVSQPSFTVNTPTTPSNQLDQVTPSKSGPRQSKDAELENSATKFNRQALAEANGYREASPRSTKACGRRQVFPPTCDDMSPGREDTDMTNEVGDESQVEDRPTMGQCSVIEKEDCQQHQVQEENLPQQEQQQEQQQQQQQEPAPFRDEFGPSVPSDEPEDTNNLEQHQSNEAQQQEIHLEPIPPVDLPGTTVREKLNSCLSALSKENENLVVCHKIHDARQAIFDFFHSVVQSKGVVGPNDTFPILHVCGAPGSGKSMTIDICSRMVTQAFLKEREEWEVPPRFSYINCSHLQNQSKQDALSSALHCADTTENNLKRPQNMDYYTRPTHIFILDEVDYLVSKHPKGTQSEQFIQTLLEWASSSHYMVGVLGISNSVENEKATRLVDLGFPRANKVVFRTYDEADLTRIALTKIGSSVVDEKAIEFLAKKVAGTSGDARKCLEMLSRSIASAMEEMSEATLNALHDKPVIKVPHVMKACNASTIKYKDLVESSPAHEKHILCICVHLARTIGSRPLTLARLLWICQQVGNVLELTSVSELKSILERLLDAGLLKWSLREDKIRFDVQLEDVESTVEEVLLNQNFYRTTLEALESLNVVQWAD